MTKKGEGGGQFVGEIPGTSIKLMNWHGFEVEVGNELGPYFLNEIEGRRTSNRSNVIIITGAPGDGKSYFAITFAEIFDPDFDPVEQIVFERAHFLKLVGNDSPLKRGQVIVVDESQYTMGSRRWYEEIQKDLMESVESVRSRGYIIIIVALHLNLLDIILRKYVLSYMIHMEERGLGTVYRLYTPRFEPEMRKYRLGQIELPLPDEEKCSFLDCLECKSLGTCMTDRAVYERRKREFVGGRSKLAEERVREVDMRLKKIPEEEVLKRLYELRGEWTYSERYNKPDPVTIMMLVERELKMKIGKDKAYFLIRRLIAEHPELRTPPQVSAPTI